MVKQTPFLRFWRALNDELVRAGRAEANFGEARALFVMCLMSI